MKRLVVGEHTRIQRGRGDDADDGERVWLDDHLYDRLRALDRGAPDERDRVLEWSDGHARTTQWVGVVQVPGVQLEILPKIDVLADDDAADPEDARFAARRNLLYMLSVSGDVPVRTRDVARLATRQAPLTETLAAIFADRLRQELLRGPERAYIAHEENLRCFKGKLGLARHVLHNAAHRERFYCRHDELVDDTLMNRIFRAACRLLLEVTRAPATQDVLRQCLLLLDGVSDAPVQDADFDRVSITRQNERFEDVLRFARIVLARRAPMVESGGARTFSLLFDMNRVFERFVAGFLRRHVMARLGDLDVLPQGGDRKRHLMTSDGAGVLRLEPDVLIVEGDRPRLVMDTKWKLLAAGKRGKGGVGDADLYQLHAYTRRYGCPRSVLLYPYIPGLEERTFEVLDHDGTPRERIAIRHVRLHRDLHKEGERAALADELERIVREGLAGDGAAGSAA